MIGFFSLTIFTFFLIYLHSLAEGRIFGSVDLHAAFDEIEWDDGCVGQSAGKGSSDHAFSVIFGGPELAAESQNEREELIF